MLKQNRGGMQKALARQKDMKRSKLVPHRQLAFNVFRWLKNGGIDE